MPPKRTQLVQAIRDAFPEDVSAAQVENWANDVVPQLDAFAAEARKQRAAVAKADASVTATPPDVVQALSAYQDIAHGIWQGSQQIRVVIGSRIPEYKEEDNLGVAVQVTVMKMLDGLQSKLLGGGGGGDEGKGVSSPSSMFALKSYLSARAAVEDKLLGKASETDEKNTVGGSRAPSTLLELRQVDVDALLKAEMAAVQLAVELRCFISAYGLNWKKLVQPRVTNDRMVS